MTNKSHIYFPLNKASVASGVESVNAKTGIVLLDSTDIGAIPTTEKGVANGVATLDANGKLTSTQIDAAVSSVNTKTGAVVLSGSDINDETLTTTQKNVTLAINELNSGKENKIQIISALSSNYYNSVDNNYIFNLNPNSDVFITDEITKTWGLQLPSTGNFGDLISVSFRVTSAQGLSYAIIGEALLINDPPQISPGNKVEIIAKYDGTDWLVIITEIEVSA